ncbi:hypothetical protein [Microcystis sp. M061S2]|uniref:hypothetical protein n=1 Tax=Microcystis sp. M061S2 TaxID=2771171 RepID=UPI0025830DE3|nr:hypothetical protein [Microcystis sp. M061S2]MCA2656316.1 hypothetical protein [Microcystis sp. M061S2]
MLQSLPITDSVKGNLTVGDLDNQNSSLFHFTTSSNLSLISRVCGSSTFVTFVPLWFFNLRDLCAFVVQSYLLSPLPTSPRNGSTERSTKAHAEVFAERRARVGLPSP